MNDPIPPNQRAATDLIAKEANSLAQADHIEALAWCRGDRVNEVSDLTLGGYRKCTRLIAPLDRVERP
jgi:hypothetical protein